MVLPYKINVKPPRKALDRSLICDSLFLYPALCLGEPDPGSQVESTSLFCFPRSLEHNLVYEEEIPQDTCLLPSDVAIGILGLLKKARSPRNINIYHHFPQQVGLTGPNNSVLLSNELCGCPGVSRRGSN